MDELPAHELLTANVRRYSEAQGMPLTVLADSIGITRERLFAIFTGDFDPDLLLLHRIAEVLEVRLSALFVEPAWSRRE